MRLKELRGLPVIDPTAARKVGTVTDYQVDPAAGRLAALDIDPVDQSDGERILGHRIRRVGRHAVILTGRAGSSATTLALDTNERWLDTASLEGLEVLGDDGDRIGRLVDASFDQDSLDIEAYLLRSTFWQRFTGRRGRIQPPKVHSCSRELMIVTSGRLKEPLPEPSDTESMGVPLKVEDRLPAPDVGRVENGQRVPADTLSS
ncbi:MAG TPA: PRC-barrel domain-containing protein [Chloroflexota bacterium]|jgi:sporulation protein YlmC with PRC-barrel domain